MKSKRNLVLIGVILSTLFLPKFTLVAQDVTHEFNEYRQESLQTDRYGMFTLGAWAVGNIAVGTYGWLESSGEKKYFSQMNTLWNTVNLGLAAYGLLNSKRFVENQTEFIKKNQRLEKIFLINAGLDFLYIGTGIYLQNRQDDSMLRKEQFSGYGKSLVLQGAFLFIFDMVMYRLKKNQRTRYQNSILIKPSAEGIGLSAAIRF
jgi:hypothetical protein